MLLQQIKLTGFGQHDGRSFSFEPGLNVIKGPNEAGKSTLQAAIMFALLGNPGHSTLDRVKRVEDHITWGRDNGFKIVLDFQDSGGADYRLQKDWESGSTRLTNLQTNDLFEDNGSVEKVISQLLGYGSLKLLQSTILVEQDAIDDIANGRREIGDQLQSIVTGSGPEEARVSAVLKELKSKIAELERGWQTSAPKNPGPIKGKLDEITEIEQRLSEIQPQVGRVEEAREQLVNLEARIKEIKTEVEPKIALKERCDAYYELTDKKKDLQAEEQKLEKGIERVEEAKQQLAETNEALKAYPGFETLALHEEQRLSELNQRCQILREEIDSQAAELAQGQLEQTTPARAGSIWWIVAALGGLILAIGLLVTGFILGTTQSPTTGILVGATGILLSLFSLIGLAAGIRQRRSAGIITAEGQVNQLEKRREQLSQVTTALDDALSSLEIADWDEFSQKLSAYKELKQARENARLQLQTLLEDQSWDDLVEQRKAVSRNRRDVEEQLETPELRKAAEVTPLDYEELESNIMSLKGELEEKENRKIQCQTRIDDALHTIEDVYLLQERKAVAEQSLDYLHNWLEVYKLTYEVMGAAKEQTLSAASVELAPRIGDHLARITDGRYSRVKADNDLNLTVYNDEKEDWVSPESEGELSRGTIDQLYLATRLALLDLLYPNTKPPLLLDDPFVKFDPERRTQALTLCQEIAQEHQVLLFTCGEDCDTFAHNVIEIAGR